MRVAACLLLLAALSPALVAQEGLTVSVAPVVEGLAEPGKEYTIKLRFTVPDGFHAYHKDNPGYSGPINVKWTELAGLKQLKETWPEPHKHVDEFSEEWELSGTFDIAYTFEVPADAAGTLVLRGKHDTQFCDENGCFQAEAEFTASIEVAGEVAPAPAKEQPKLTATLSAEPATAGGTATVKLAFAYPRGWFACHKDNPGYWNTPDIKWTVLSGLSLKEESWPEPTRYVYDDSEEWVYPDGVTITCSFEVPADALGELNLKARYSVELYAGEDAQEFKGEVETTLAVEPAAPSSATDEHGFYVDFDYALAQAKAENKPLLVDFNGRY
ncbi:MAG: protein-disulfide reductase DsbD N-terminal domain-containing protein [Planctomycetota bacterium]|nr:protein-disulfide reductase DsbD N-terminal domain-containing protein [Planctomycetota bacterium]